MYPPLPWPLLGIKSAKPTSSTLLRPGFATQGSQYLRGGVVNIRRETSGHLQAGVYRSR